MTFRSLFIFLCLLAMLPEAMAQSADQEVVSVIDSPDPVVPGQTITYTVTMRNHGPNPASNGGLNVNLAGSLSHVSNTPPPGFSCFVSGANMTCNTPSFAVGAEVQITIVARLEASLLNFPDGSVTSVFFPSGTTPDPVTANNQKTSVTAWDSPQVDLQMAVADAPDPVGPDQNITFTGVITQAGPNTATNVNFNVFNNGTLRYQSVTAPQGFTCTPPTVGATPQFTCNAPSVPPGSYPFTVVLRADDDILGPNDGSVSTYFGVAGTGNDTNTGNNDETEVTAYVTPKADLAVSVVDSPDPVGPDQNIVYTIVVSQNGPAVAPNVNFNVFNNGSLRYQSVSAPAGFTCAAPNVGAAPQFTCSAPTLAVGTYNFTVVLRADDDILGPNDGSVSTVFSAISSIADPVPANNSETEATTYVTPDADLSIAVDDLPDPALLDGTIEYLATLRNAGPQSATNATINVFNSGTLRYVGIDAPVGANCTLPNVGSAPTLSCTVPTLAAGADLAIILTVRSDTALTGPNSVLVSSVFSASSPTQDPQGTNNSETEQTQILAQTLFKNGFE